MGIKQTFYKIAEEEGITNTYIIASNWRSGSTLLNRGLLNSTIGGSANEHFTYNNHQGTVKNLDDFKIYLRKLYQTKKADNGVFGSKIMYPAFNWIYKLFTKAGINEYSHGEIIESIFPNLKYIYIYRKDRLRQAISIVRATQSQVWHISKGSNKKQQHNKLSYDSEKITHHILEIIQAELQWESFFQEHNIHPFVITYENFVESYEPTLREVIEFLDLPNKDKAKYPAPQLIKTADELTDLWVESYLKENQWLANSMVRNQLCEHNNHALAIYSFLKQYKDPAVREKALTSVILLSEDPSIVTDIPLYSKLYWKSKSLFTKKLKLGND